MNRHSTRLTKVIAAFLPVCSLCTRHHVKPDLKRRLGEPAVEGYERPAFRPLPAPDACGCELEHISSSERESRRQPFGDAAHGLCRENLHPGSAKRF